MTTKNVFIWIKPDGKSYSKATIAVPGLGDVEIENALTDELRERIMAESLTALRVKLGHVIVAKIATPPVQSDQHADTDPHEKDAIRCGERPFERNAERRPVDEVL